MIESLTKEQEARFQEFVDKWTKIGLCTDPADRKEAEAGLIEAYKIGGFKKPIIVWTDSPMSQGLVFAIMSKMKDMEKRINPTRCIAIPDKLMKLNKVFPESVWSSVMKTIVTQIPKSHDEIIKIVKDIGIDALRTIARDTLSNSAYGQHEAGWLSFYDFFREVCGLMKETENLSGIMRVAKSAGWWLPYDTTCWICDRHEVVNRDDQGRLHHMDEAALRYPDNWKIYAIHGVRYHKQDSNQSYFYEWNRRTS
jgi:hypothetical protein